MAIRVKPKRRKAIDVAAFVKWLTSEEKWDREQLEQRFNKVFDRGYFLGRAHARSEALSWIEDRQ